jgi:hypothetical protein
MSGDETGAPTESVERTGMSRSRLLCLPDAHVLAHLIQQLQLGVGDDQVRAEVLLLFPTV